MADQLIYHCLLCRAEQTKPVSPHAPGIVHVLSRAVREDQGHIHHCDDGRIGVLLVVGAGEATNA